MKETQGEIEINLRDIFGVLLKRWVFILIATILGAGIFFGYAKATYVPTYKSTAKMYVNNNADSINTQVGGTSQSDIYASQALVNTYCEMIKARLTLDEVIKRENLGDRYNYEKLLSMLSCGSVNDTEVFYVSIVSTDPIEAKNIVNAIVSVVPEQIEAIIEGSSVKTVDAAVEGKLLSSGITTKTLIGAAIGLVLSCVFFFVYDIIINDTLQSEEWIEESFKGDIPLLAVIPDVNHASGKGYRRYKYYRHSYYESHTDKDEAAK